MEDWVIGLVPFCLCLYSVYVIVEHYYWKKKNVKYLRKKKRKSLLTYYFGFVFTLILLIGLVSSNTGEYGEVRHKAETFLKLMHDQKYIEASKYVDVNKISLAKLKDISSLASRYDVTTFGNLENGTYEAGYKSVLGDDYKSNDKVLEFIFAEAKGKWKIVSYHFW